MDTFLQVRLQLEYNPESDKVVRANIKSAILTRGAFKNGSCAIMSGIFRLRGLNKKEIPALKPKSLANQDETRESLRRLARRTAFQLVPCYITLVFLAVQRGDHSCAVSSFYRHEERITGVGGTASIGI